MRPDKGLQVLPSVALLSGAVTASAQKQAALIRSEGQSTLPLVQIHPVHVLGVFQRQHIGAALIQPEKIAAVLVEDGEMGGHDDRLRPNGPPVGLHRTGGEFKSCGALPDVQALRDARGKLQRVKLRLVPEPDGAGGPERKGQVLDQVRRDAQVFQGLQLPPEFFRAVQRVNIGVPTLQAAGDLPAQLPVLGQGGLVGLPVQPGFFGAQ